jgi:hypothetical protein
MSAVATVTNADVARIARLVCEQRSRGVRRHRIGRVEFDLRQVGRCAQFVRECHEAALGLPEYSWEHRAPSAAMMEHRLAQAGLTTADPQPGDILGMSGAVPRDRWNDWAWQKTTRRYGHIGIYLGDGLLGENTSSSRRGPGHVISALDLVQDRITSYYRVLPSAEMEDGVPVWLMPDHEPIMCHARLEDGVTRADLRALAEALGFAVDYRDGEVLVGSAP